MIYPILQGPLVSVILIVVKAYCLVHTHKWFPLLLALYAPPTSGNCRRDKFLIPHISGKACTLVSPVDITNPSRSYLCIHKLSPLSLVQHPNGIRSLGKETPPHIINCSVLMTFPNISYYHYVVHKPLQVLLVDHRIYNIY